MAKKQSKVIRPQDTGAVIDGTFSFKPETAGVRVSLDGSFVACADSEDAVIEFDSRNYSNGVHEFKVEHDGVENVSEFCFANKGRVRESADALRKKWEAVIGRPRRPFTPNISLVRQFERSKFSGYIIYERVQITP